MYWTQLLDELAPDMILVPTHSYVLLALDSRQADKQQATSNKQQATQSNQSQ
jgi:hypothetical protein